MHIHKFLQVGGAWKVLRRSVAIHWSSFLQECPVQRQLFCGRSFAAWTIPYVNRGQVICRVCPEGLTRMAESQPPSKRQKSCNNPAPDASDSAKFGALFDKLLDDILADDAAANPEIIDATKRFKKMLEYNIPGGKRNRGLTVVNSFRQLAKEDMLTESRLEQAMVLGWCIEFLQAYFLISDDIMDQSKTRRGQPCWYKMPNVGNDAINDSFFVEACIYKLLKKYIGKEQYYVNVLEVFHETTCQTVIGQSLDLITSPENDRDLNRFTEERYATIVKWKTAFYSFYLPVALAMYMVGISDETSHNNAKKILLQMGHFFQVQDDFLDCFGEPEVIGKIGTDIEENKCSWLVVQALKRVTPEQRKIIEDNYGIDDCVKVAAIKQLYRDLDLQGVYHQYERESYFDLLELIDEFSCNLPQDMFLVYANRIYKRSK